MNPSKLLAIICSIFAVATLMGAAHAQMPPPQAQTHGHPPGHLKTQNFNFAYKVSDARVNVFDDGRNTRIQLPEGTVLPVALTTKSDGTRLIELQREGLYLVVPGVHQSLRFVWSGGREVTAEFTGRGSAERLGPPAAFGSAVPAAQFGAAVKPVPAQRPTTASAIDKAVVLAEDKGATASLVAPSVALMPMTAVAVAAPALEFRLTPPETVRAALERWSKQAGWVFGPDLWVAPVDIPVATSADMGSDYRAAVRKLLDATSLTDVPLQPCFYSNSVLRVVSRSQLCDRL
jgi:hypothetical protein